VRRACCKDELRADQIEGDREYTRGGEGNTKIEGREGCWREDALILGRGRLFEASSIFKRALTNTNGGKSKRYIKARNDAFNRTGRRDYLTTKARSKGKPD